MSDGYETLALMRGTGWSRRAALAGMGSIALLGVPSPAARAKPARLDPAALAPARRRAEGLDQLRGLIVAQDGDVLLAEAFRGPRLDRAVNVKSVSKTLVASLVGAALDRGVLDTVALPLSEAAPGLIPSDADPRVGAITLDDLLTMRAGLERTSGPGYGAWVNSRDWVRHALTRPFTVPPGTAFQYSTGNFHLLGAVLTERTQRSLLMLARDWLGEPLDIALPPWTRDPKGYYMGGNNMELSPMALLRFAEMARARGRWNGARVLSQDWIETSWRPRSRSPFSGHAYGYGWFLAQASGETVAYARGYGGQMVYVIPSLRLSVIVTSDPSRPARSAGYAGVLNRMLAEDIVRPALEA